MRRPTGQEKEAGCFSPRPIRWCRKSGLAYRFSAYVPVGRVRPVAREVPHPRFLLCAPARAGKQSGNEPPEVLTSGPLWMLEFEKGFHRSNDLEFAR